ncbi:MAG: PIN domain-containing protein [Gaiella sp.]
MRPFVDTNILVYANDAADARKQQVARETLLEHADSLVLSAQVLSEFYVVVTRRFSRLLPVEDARTIVDELRQAPIVVIDERLVLDAIAISASTMISYWDGLIVAAARSGGCDVLLTEDLSHGSTIAGVRIENPFRL